MQLGTLAPLPDHAAWYHHSARDATEIVACSAIADGFALSGVVTGVEDEEPVPLGSIKRYSLVPGTPMIAPAGER